MNDSAHIKTRRFGTGFILLVFAAGLLAGVVVYRLFSSPKPGHDHAQQTAAASDESKEEVWTCSMHPQIRQPKPGKCPICFMDLIPVAATKSDAGPRVVEYAPETLKLMELETSPVERKLVQAQVRLVGKVDYDETRVKTITARVPGRIDKLLVNFTGTRIEQGAPMAELYSPELLSAQAELLQAVSALPKDGAAADTIIQRTLAQTAEASREKLRLLGLGPEQIQVIEKSGKATDHITINAPIGGVVVEKQVSEGDYVETGQPFFRIADLSTVWVMLQAYEADLPHIRLDQAVEFTTPSHPGEVFNGTVSFIDPLVDPQTRTVAVRASADNADGYLKPEMFVRAILQYTPSAADSNAPLVVPATAPLITGKRAVVYVRLPHVEKPTFEGREIVLGPRAGDYYIVEQGLAEGEQVVTKGAFKIDADLQIQAKPSMMSPGGGSSGTMHDHGGHAAAPVTAAQSVDESTEQTTCPVMGGAVDKTIFTVYQGKKVYFCCAGCKPEFERNPEKYISGLPQFKNAQP